VVLDAGDLAAIDTAIPRNAVAGARYGADELARVGL
jgi:hypothetical protein